MAGAPAVSPTPTTTAAVRAVGDQGCKGRHPVRATLQSPIHRGVRTAVRAAAPVQVPPGRAAVSRRTIPVLRTPRDAAVVGLAKGTSCNFCFSLSLAPEGVYSQPRR